jgi:hypothetical protein
MHITDYEFLAGSHSRIENLKFPEHWKEQGTKPPNRTAKFNAFGVCFYLFQDYGLQPKTIACTIESGVYLTFVLGSTELSIETYNEGDICALVNKDRQILISEEIVDFDFERVVNVFKKAEQNQIEASNQT